MKRPALTSSSFEDVVLCGISTPFGMLSPALGKITHVLLTRAPLYRGRSPFSCDLHVLSAPLTFVLSQDQTLQLNLVSPNKLARSKPRFACGSNIWNVESRFGRLPARYERCGLPRALREPTLFEIQPEGWSSVKVSVRFSFQGPREPPFGVAAPFNREANLSCASRAGQLLFLRGSLFCGGPFPLLAQLYSSERGVSRGEEQLSCSTLPRQEGFSFFSEPLLVDDESRFQENPQRGIDIGCRCRSAAFLRRGAFERRLIEGRLIHRLSTERRGVP